MKLQDLFPYDSAILGLDGMFSTIEPNSFFIYTQHICAKNNIITLNKYYLISEGRSDYIEVYLAKLLDVVCIEKIVFLLFQTGSIRRTFVIDLEKELDNFYTSFKIVDMQLYLDLIEEEVVKDYCKKDKPCDSSNSDNLLEFNFSAKS